MKGEVGTLNIESWISLRTVRYGSLIRGTGNVGAIGSPAGTRRSLYLARQSLLIIKCYVAVMFTCA